MRVKAHRSDLHQFEQIEYIHAVKDDDWHMAGMDVSKLFLLVMGENWNKNIRHPYWEELYKPLLKRLDKQPHSFVQVALRCLYTHGLIDERQVSSLITDFSRVQTQRLVEMETPDPRDIIGMMVRVSSRDLPAGTVAVCQMSVLDCTISKLQLA